MWRAFGLDIGSTQIKLGGINDKGKLEIIKSLPAPKLEGNHLIRQRNPEDFLSIMEFLLQEISSSVFTKIPLGIACQRSSFLLWEKDSGKPVTPMISWQDRRPVEWCEQNKKYAAEITRRTGLLLSPHYVGPKLAHLFQKDGSLKQKAFKETLLFGTLETWLIWNWTQGQVHETDLSMAARTLLVDLELGTWSEELLSIFGVPRCLLPTITSTTEKTISIHSGYKVTCTIADQAAGLLALGNEHSGAILVNLGTGGFVLHSSGKYLKKKSGYLSSPILQKTSGETLYCIEGTINGISQAIDRYSSKPISLTQIDSTPQCFCSPETAGLGSPYWRPEIPFSLSDSAQELDGEDKRRIILEGIIFRICEIVENLFDRNTLPKILLSGGLSDDVFLYQGLAACMGCPIYKVSERETTLLGAACLALPQSSFPQISVITHGRRQKENYLRPKFYLWKKWLQFMISDTYFP